MCIGVIECEQTGIEPQPSQIESNLDPTLVFGIVFIGSMLLGLGLALTSCGWWEAYLPYDNALVGRPVFAYLR